MWNFGSWQYSYLRTKRLYPNFQSLFSEGGQCPTSLDKHWKELFPKILKEECIMKLEERILPLPHSRLPLGLLPTTGACKVWSCLSPAEWFQKKEAHLFTRPFQTFAGTSDLTQRLCRKSEGIYSLCYELLMMCDTLPSIALLKSLGFSKSQKSDKKETNFKKKFQLMQCLQSPCSILAGCCKLKYQEEYAC